MKRLKKRIEANGVQCWMDIGQMGGGDALFAKIDAGIRACKVSIGDFSLNLLSLSVFESFVFLRTALLHRCTLLSV